jgi:predicted  nucleic acid-binding Zn-ribbon protein
MTQQPTTSVAVIGQAQPSPPIVAVGLNWAVLIPLIFSGIALLITTSVSAWNSVRAKQESRATKAAVDVNAANGAQAGAERDKKLDTITILVNGRYGQVLQELADVKRILAASTGLESDRTAATVAQTHADDQAGRVATVAASPPKELT